MVHLPLSIYSGTISFRSANWPFMLSMVNAYGVTFADVKHNLSDVVLQERKSFRLKLSLMVFNVTCFLLAIYFFFRHNSYCESGGKMVEWLLTCVILRVNYIITLLKLCL